MLSHLVIDAVPAATSLATAGPTTVLTAGPEDLTALCGNHVTVIEL
ncbi:hypothetical protein [Kitasatospora sp. NPDC050543]